MTDDRGRDRSLRAAALRCGVEFSAMAAGCRRRNRQAAEETQAGERTEEWLHDQAKTEQRDDNTVEA